MSTKLFYRKIYSHHVLQKRGVFFFNEWSSQRAVYVSLIMSFFIHYSSGYNREILIMSTTLNVRFSESKLLLDVMSKLKRHVRCKWMEKASENHLLIKLLQHQWCWPVVLSNELKFKMSRYYFIKFKKKNQAMSQKEMKEAFLSS